MRPEVTLGTGHPTTLPVGPRSPCIIFRVDVPSALLKIACSPLSQILGCRLVFQFSGFASRKDFWCDFIF